MGESTAQRRVVSAYEKWAPIYDWIYRGYIDATLAVALRAMQLDGTGRILDVACGTGELERRIVAHFPAQQIVGIDITEAMLRRAREKLAGVATVQFQQAAGESLPFADAEFDLVVNCSALHYMRRPERFFTEAARVVKPGGRFIIIDWCGDAFRGKFYHAWRGFFFRSHHKVYSMGEVRSLWRVAGLTEVGIHRFSVAGFWALMCAEARKA